MAKTGQSSETALGLTAEPNASCELFVTDATLARALYEGVPCGRLLARVRLGRIDSEDATSWNTLLDSLATGNPRIEESVRRALARHNDPALDEGPLVADNAVTAALVAAVAWSGGSDASLSEVATALNEHTDGPGGGCTRVDARLALPGHAAPVALMEASIRLAMRMVAGPWRVDRFLHAIDLLSGEPFRISLEPADRYPLGDARRPSSYARLVCLDRFGVDTLLSMAPQDLAGALVRATRSDRARAPSRLDSFVADLAALLQHPGALVFRVRMPESTPEPQKSLPSIPPAVPSSRRLDWDGPTTAWSLAREIESGELPPQRARAIVGEGGDPALDAIGREMLNVAAHPRASAAFAEIIARVARPRDVIRLVTYFAVAPDAPRAAEVIAGCSAPELPSVLRSWLEAMLPADGTAVRFGDNPDTSAGARIARCVESLEPYPRLYAAVSGVLQRVEPPRISMAPQSE